MNHRSLAVNGRSVGFQTGRRRFHRSAWVSPGKLSSGGPITSGRCRRATVDPADPRRARPHRRPVSVVGRPDGGRESDRRTRRRRPLKPRRGSGLVPYRTLHQTALTCIYRKLSVRSRAELARLLTSKRIGPPPHSHRPCSAGHRKQSMPRSPSRCLAPADAAWIRRRTGRTDDGIVRSTV